MVFNPRDQERLVSATSFSPIADFRSSFRKQAPWDSIVDFVRHKSFCGMKPFPRQLTLLKLIFLETENMTQYDIDVINEWRRGFVRSRGVFGVQPDIWERVAYLKARGYRRFPHIQAVLGRRASKGFIGGVLGAEQMAYLLSLGDFQAYYGIDTGKDAFLNVGATSQTQAQRHQFGDIKRTIEKCVYLQPHIAEAKDHVVRLRTAADIRRIGEMKAAKVPIDHLIASLWAVPLSASSVSGRGATSLANFFDEFAFLISGTNSVKSSEEIYEDWQPSLGQFRRKEMFQGHLIDVDDSLTYVPSSPFTKTGQFYILYQRGGVLMSNYSPDADEEEASYNARTELLQLAAARDDDVAELKAEPTMLIFQGASWDLYRDWEDAPRLIRVRFPNGAPESDLTDEIQRRRKLHNPEKFAVEREGQFAEVFGQYLDRDKVDAMFAPTGWRRPELSEQTVGSYQHRYRIHLDPAKSGANFSLAMGHLENSPCDGCGWYNPDLDATHICPQQGRVWPHVIIDYLHVWKKEDFPPDEETGKATINYVTVTRDIKDILGRFGSTTKVSFDQWNSLHFIHSLREEYSPRIRFSEVTFTQASNYARCEKFKTLLSLGWIHSYRDRLGDDNTSLLELEMKFLSEHNGRVEKQDSGPVQTKDLFDSVCVVATDLLADQLDKYSGEYLNHSAFGSTNVAGLRSGRELERMATVGSSMGLNRVNTAREQLLAQSANTSRSRNTGYSPARQSSIHNRINRKGR